MAAREDFRLTGPFRRELIAHCHLRRSNGFHAHAVQVLKPHPAGIGRVTTFLDPSIFPVFGLLPALDTDRTLAPAR